MITEFFKPKSNCFEKLKFRAQEGIKEKIQNKYSDRLAQKKYIN